MKTLSLSVLLVLWPSVAFGQLVSAEPLNNYPNQGLVQRLQDGFVQDLNQRLDLPEPVLMTSGDCGQANAFFRSDNGNGVAQITFCSELVAAIVEEFQYDAMSDQEFSTAVMGSVAFVLAHEIGHALVKVLDLPVLGREEDAADGLAALMLSETPELAFWAAEYWRQKDDFGDTGLFKMLGRTVAPFFDEHGLDEQRYFNVLCWIYGADPGERRSLLQFIPTSRAERCPREYQQLTRSWDSVLGISDAVAPSLGARSPLAGTWKFSETIVNRDLRLLCQNSGSISWGGAAVRGAMTQTGTCQVQDDSFSSDGESELSSVDWSEPYLTFEADQCVYRGWQLSNHEVAGTLTCQIVFQDNPVELLGTWVATRPTDEQGVR